MSTEATALWRGDSSGVAPAIAEGVSVPCGASGFRVGKRGVFTVCVLGRRGIGSTGGEGTVGPELLFGGIGGLRCRWSVARVDGFRAPRSGVAARSATWLLGVGFRCWVAGGEPLSGYYSESCVVDLGGAPGA